MIEFAAALQAVLDNAHPLPSRSMKLAQSLGHCLAMDIFSPLDHPIFDQSAVDGYAIRFEDLGPGGGLLLESEIKAGDTSGSPLTAGNCRRIFTGAPVPQGADTVVMQEFCEIENGLLRVLDKGLKMGGNVRKKAEQIRKGQLALKAGSRLNPAAIGFLASLGIAEAKVVSKPKVKVIVTGNEFVEEGQEMQEGQIHESNGIMLMAALAQIGLEGSYEICKDNLEAIAAKVAEFSASCDLLILTGGVSVGDYDFSAAALAANGVEIVFHKVNQKPGKPLLFGKSGNQLFFGLPGNPRAVMLCFQLYVLPALLRLQGANQDKAKTLSIPLAHEYQRNTDGKTHFVTGSIAEGRLNLLGGQQSHMLQSLAEADCITILPPNPIQYKNGDRLECLLLP